jgi:outer membrane protein OmpA-like peptidoglycan-associated protein/tetratricopeptide (TPR) repeat protein
LKYYFLYFGKKLSGAVYVVLISSAALFAQEQKSVLRMADEAYSRQEYATAADLYEKLVQSKGKKVKTTQLINLAVCYRETGQFNKAGSWYEKITALPDCPAAVWFDYGEVLRNQELYQEAKLQYGRFNTSVEDSVALKALMLRSCDSAIVWKEKPAVITLTGVDALNTDHSEVISGVVKDGLLLVANGYRKMMLNGKVEKHPDNDKRIQQPYYKPYLFKQYSTGDSNIYLEELFPQLLGDYRYHVGPVCLNKAEDTLYVTINEQEKVIPGGQKGVINGIRRLYIYQAVKQDGKWGKPVKLPVVNQEGYSSSYPVLAAHSSLLYFVSDRPGGYGHTDIWYSEKQEDGSWGAPVNCGPVINTIAAEGFPTVNEEGALYFSSKGHVGMGGYDIYRAKGNRSQWSEPVNLKSPFNTGGDDIGLILKHNGYEGFLSSNRSGGHGSDDIYSFRDAHYFERLTDRELPVGFVPGNTSGSGQTSVGKEDGLDKNKVVAKRELTPEEQKDKHAIEQLQFLYNYNSVELLTESRRILDYVVSILNKHPEWKLLVVSYTDSRGTDIYNRDLSSLRCYAVINYLDDRGFSATRVYYRNMGEDAIKNGCKDGVPCNELQHQQNRRSELKVIF